MDTILVENWKYRPCLGKLRLSGNVYNHPTHQDGQLAYLSTPTTFNEVTMEVEGKSGRMHKLCNCAGDVAEEMERIRKDIQRGHAEVF
jgi:hypothetical protein